MLLLVDDEDLDEDGEDSDGYDDCDFGLRSRACHTGAADKSNGDIHEDQDANAAKVESEFSKCISVLSLKAVTCKRQSSVYCYCRFLTLLTFPRFLQEKRRMLKVRLDIFHALQRLSRLLKKSHGAFRPFMARLRDACFIVNLADIEEASVPDVTSAFARILTSCGNECRRFAEVCIATNTLLPISVPIYVCVR